MAIVKPVPQAATKVKSMTVLLERWTADDEKPAGESARYQIVLLDQDSRRIRFDTENGDALPHWTQAAKDAAQAIMDESWGVAAEILL